MNRETVPAAIFVMILLAIVAGWFDYQWNKKIVKDALKEHAAETRK